MYHLKVDNLMKQRQRKEIRLQELDRKNHESFLKAINKEIQTNIEAGAYQILGDKESAWIRQQCPEKIMESRFVLTAKPLEPRSLLNLKKSNQQKRQDFYLTGSQKNHVRPRLDM